jgi:hypothetical protein
MVTRYPLIEKFEYLSLFLLLIISTLLNWPAIRIIICIFIGAFTVSRCEKIPLLVLLHRGSSYDHQGHSGRFVLEGQF